MRYRMVPSHLLPFLLIYLLLISKAEAKNYVILSVTKEGLREVRLAYRGRLILETSLMSGTSQSGLALSRASDEIRLVETVSRDGLIEDCAVMESHGDVTAFVSDFSRVRPDNNLVPESDVMDVYLGHKNITDPIFVAKHSNNNPNNITFSSALTSQDTTGSEEHDDVNEMDHFKLTAKIKSIGTSTFMQMFRRHFRIKMTTRKCRQFYGEAKKRLELLTYLAEQPVEQAHATLRRYLNHTEGGGDDLNPQYRRSRHHHHHHQNDIYHKKRDNAIISSSRENQPMPYSSHQKFLNNDLEKFQFKDAEDTNSVTNTTTNSSDSLRHTAWNSSADSVSNFSTSASSVSSSHIQSSEIQFSDITSSNVQAYHRKSSFGVQPSSGVQSSPGVQSSSGVQLFFGVQSSPDVQSSRRLQAPRGVQSYSPNVNTTQTLTPSLLADEDSHDNATAHMASHAVKVRTPDGHDEESRRRHGAFRESAEYIEDSPTAFLSSRSRSKRDLLTGWMIFPGTKWCGDGDIAENKKDLGYHAELDKCCRRHDLCPLVIPRLSWKYGMFNFRLHTISHCRCDRKFRKCLKLSNSPLAHLIGQIFFNVVGPQCFKFNKETSCLQRFWWGGCQEWGESKVAYVKRQRRFK